jgi:PhnB protein
MDKNTPTVSLSITVKDGNAALEFYKKALGAEVTLLMPDPGGGVVHAEMLIGTSKVYLSGESPEWHAEAMPEGMLAPCLFAIATDDSDASFKRAVDAGGVPLKEPENMFWGVRESMIRDPFGYRWSFGQFVEEVSPEEFQRRAKELFGS